MSEVVLEYFSDRQPAFVEEEAASDSFSEGYSAGYRDGVEVGTRSCKESVADQIDNLFVRLLHLLKDLDDLRAKFASELSSLLYDISSCVSADCFEKSLIHQMIQATGQPSDLKYEQISEIESVSRYQFRIADAVCSYLSGDGESFIEVESSLASVERILSSENLKLKLREPLLGPLQVCRRYGQEKLEIWGNNEH